MKKRSLLIVAILLATAVACALCFGACDSVNPEYGQTDPFENVGAPEASPAKRLDYSSSMTAADLLDIGFYNYYNADYVVSANYGYNATIGGGMDMNGQYIDGYKIRKGVYNDADPLSADCYHLSRSGGLAQKTWEEGLIVDGDLRHRITDSSNIAFSKDTQMIRIEDADNFKYTEYGDDLDSYNNTVCNDPTKILMYDIFDTGAMKLIRSSIDEEGDVSYDAAKGVYSFKIKFDPEESTVDYIRVIEANLKKTSKGARISEFTKLELNVEMWESGLIKKIAVSEQYKFVMALPLTNDYWANVYFAWDEGKTGYAMSDYRDAFTSNIAIERNNKAYDNAGGKESMGLIAKIVAIVVPILVVLIAAIAVGVYFGVKRKKLRRAQANDYGAASVDNTSESSCDDRSEAGADGVDVADIAGDSEAAVDAGDGNSSDMGGEDSLSEEDGGDISDGDGK